MAPHGDIVAARSSRDPGRLAALPRGVVGAVRRRRRPVAVPLLGVARGVVARASAGGASSGSWRRATARAVSPGCSPSPAARGPSGVRRWRLLGNGVTGADHLDVLSRAADAPAVREAIARALAEDGRGLGRPRPRGPALRLADRAGAPARHRGRAARAPRSSAASSARGSRCAGTFEEHLARVRRRETYGRRVRWLARQPGFRIDVATSPGEAPAALEELPAPAPAALGRGGRLRRASRPARSRTSTARWRRGSPRAAGSGSTRSTSRARRSRRCTGSRSAGASRTTSPATTRPGPRGAPGSSSSAAPSRTPTRAASPTTTSCAGRSPTSSTGRADRRETCTLRVRRAVAARRHRRARAGGLARGARARPGGRARAGLGGAPPRAPRASTRARSRAARP